MHSLPGRLSALSECCLLFGKRAGQYFMGESCLSATLRLRQPLRFAPGSDIKATIFENIACNERGQLGFSPRAFANTTMRFLSQIASASDSAGRRSAAAPCGRVFGDQPSRAVRLSAY